MEATCSESTPLHTSPTGRHPSMVIVHLVFVVVKLRDSGMEGTTRPSSHFKAIWLHVWFCFAHP
jgi:hypothetical protein